MMDVMEALYTRRSIRKYRNEPVSREQLLKLLEAATLAPSGSNLQPWSFAVIQDSGLLQSYSDRAKTIFLNWMADKPDPQNYKTLLAKADFNIFYNAGTLVIIYAAPGNPMAYGDCAMAAQNLMLAAHAAGLGSCWIGFAMGLFDSAEFKRELGIPETHKAVAPLILGCPETVSSGYSRKPPEVLAWK